MKKAIGGFVNECCLVARNARSPAVELYLTYVRWCLVEGVPVQDQFTFLRVLECYGLRYGERDNESWFRGVAVRPEYRLEPQG